MSDVVRCDVPCDNACDSSTRMDGTKHMSEMQGVVVRRYNTVQYLYLMNFFVQMRLGIQLSKKLDREEKHPRHVRKCPLRRCCPKKVSPITW